MVALVGALGGFHVAQQGVHFREAEATIGAYRAMAGAGGEDFVAALCEHMAGRLLGQLGEQGARELFELAAGQQGGYGAHGELFRADRSEREAQLCQGVGVFFGGGALAGVGAEYDGNEQALHRRSRIGAELEFFVEDALVGGVHVDEDQSLRVLGEDVDTVQLGDGVAERMVGVGACRRIGGGWVVGLLNKSEIGAGSRFAYGEAGLLRRETRRWRDGMRCCCGTNATNRRQWLRQHTLQGVENELVDALAVAKAHFDLGRMDVGVDERRIDVEKQYPGRVMGSMQHVGIGGARGVDEQLVLDVTAVDVEVLFGARVSGVGGQGGESDQPQGAGAGFDGARVTHEVLAHQFACAAGKLGGGETATQLAVVRQGKCDLGLRLRHARQHLVAAGELGGNGLEEFASRRGVEIQVGYGDGRAGALRSGLNGLLCGVDLPGVRGVGGAAGYCDARDRSDGGERFAAKAVTGDALQVGQAGDLAGGVACQRQRQIVLVDAAAVVRDADQPDATFLDLYVDFCRAGIQAVFDQFLEHRGGPLNNLAGGYLTDQEIGKGVYSRHGGIIGVG